MQRQGQRAVGDALGQRQRAALPALLHVVVLLVQWLAVHHRLHALGGEVLDDLGRDGVLQVLVEGGASVAGQFHRAGLVDRYVIYLAPALFGGGDARGLFTGPGVYTVDELWRGRFLSVERVGDDLRVEMEPADAAEPADEQTEGA